MARLNVTRNVGKTHEGTSAWGHLTAEQKLRRSVLSCMLWEREFYEEGEDIAARICRLAGEVSPSIVAALAAQARSNYKLRHTPLLLAASLANRVRGTSLVSQAIAETIQRADELAEFLAVYAQVNGIEVNRLKFKGAPLGAGQKGLGTCLSQFDAYALAKYDRRA